MEFHHNRMNHCVPDWSMEDDYGPVHSVLPQANQRKSARPDHELIEILWQNGHVVMHSQTNRKTTAQVDDIKQCQRPESTLKCGGTLDDSAKILDEEVTTSWIQYPIDDSLDKEFYSEFYALPPESPTVEKIKDDALDGERFGKYGMTAENHMECIVKQSSGLYFEENVVPPKSQILTSFPRTTGTGDVMNFSHFSRPLKQDLGPINLYPEEKNLGNKNQGETGDSPSSMTKEESICASNQVQGEFNMDSFNAVRVSSEKAVKKDAQTGFTSDRNHTDTHDTTVTSSSGGVDGSFGRTGQKCSSSKSHKRKGRDTDESELQSEEAGYESMEGNRASQRSSSARRSRAAEVHNLAERRRRDRINEKMRALQELIPNCNKSDKASMLDEAIEYLKSLQLQLQMMWMGSSMAAMMFPGMQQYMSHIGMGMSMGMGHGLTPPIRGPIHLPRIPLVGQSMPSNPAVNQACPRPSPFVGPVNFQRQMQGSPLPESYGQYLGSHHMQPSPQAINLYSSMLIQQKQMALAASGGVTSDVAASSENAQNAKTG